MVVLRFLGHSLKLFIFPKSSINTIKTEHRYLPSKTKSANSPSYNFLYYSNKELICVAIKTWANHLLALQRYTDIYHFQYLNLSLQFYSISYLYFVVEVGIKHEPWLETHLLQSCLSRVSSKGPG